MTINDHLPQRLALKITLISDREGVCYQESEMQKKWEQE